MPHREPATTEEPGRPLLERLQARTAKRVQHASRGPDYNIPLKWYMKTNGDIVKLQADPTNRAWYEDKGYTLLRPDEVQEWEGTVRKEVVKEQRKKAAIINTIRRIGAKNPGIEVGLSDDMEIPELENILNQLGKATGSPTGVFIGRMKEEPTYEEEDEDIRGVELGGGKEEFEAKLKRSVGALAPSEPATFSGAPPSNRGEPHKLVKGTGYDPLTGRALPRE